MSWGRICLVLALTLTVSGGGAHGGEQSTEPETEAGERRPEPGGEVGGLFGLFGRSQAEPDPGEAEAEEEAEQAERSPAPSDEEKPAAEAETEAEEEAEQAERSPAPSDEETPAAVDAAEVPGDDEAVGESEVAVEEETAGDPESIGEDTEAAGIEKESTKPEPTPDLDADIEASRRSVEAGADVELPPQEILGEIEKPDIFFLLPKARSRSDEQVIRARIRREITRPLIKDWLEEELLLK